MIRCTHQMGMGRRRWAGGDDGLPKVHSEGDEGVEDGAVGGGMREIATDSLGQGHRCDSLAASVARLPIHDARLVKAR